MDCLGESSNNCSLKAFVQYRYVNYKHKQNRNDPSHMNTHTDRDFEGI